MTCHDLLRLSATLMILKTSFLLNICPGDEEFILPKIVVDKLAFDFE